MRRLAATIGTDVRVQFRNGFYIAAAVVVVASILLLRWLPSDVAALFLPVVLLQNVLVNTFYFVGGLLLLERNEGTFVAQSVTPLRDHEYLAAKLLTLTALSLIESLLIAVALHGIDGRMSLMAVGIALAAVLFCLAGVALAVRYDSINEFILPSVLYASLLTLPLLRYFGAGPAAWYRAHPIDGPLLLMQIDAPHTALGLTAAIGYPVLWLAPVYWWSLRALRRTRNA